MSHARPLVKDDIGKKIVKTRPTKSGDYSYCGGESDGKILLNITWSDKDKKEISELLLKGNNFEHKLKEKELFCDWVVIDNVKNIPFDEAEYLNELLNLDNSKPSKDFEDFSFMTTSN